MPLDLTVYFSGTARDEILGPHARLVPFAAGLQYGAPEISCLMCRITRTWLLTIGDWRVKLANYDVIHTTDGFFAFRPHGGAREPHT